MSTTTARRAPKQGKESGIARPSDPYQQVTDLIVEHLEKGIVPWRCPWNREVGRPRSFQSGKPYRGINSILLGCRFAASAWWMTYRQAMERGGHVRKGEHGAMVVKFGTFEPKGQADVSADGPKRRRGYLRRFTVFNATQIEGIVFPEPVSTPKLSADQRIAEAEAIVAAMPQCPVIHEGRGTRACYRPVIDEIEMPSFGSFESAEAFHLTVFHELAHATGHATRLNRRTLTQHEGFGGPVYSEEELVAEMTAAFVGMEADIVRDRHEQSAAYLQGWLSVLRSRDHRQWIVKAASQAALAADFILGRHESAASAEESSDEQTGEAVPEPAN